MEVGSGARVYRLPGDMRPTVELYDELVETAMQFEAEGFDFCLISEHHFESDQWNPSPLTALAFIAAKTSTLRLGTNIIQAPYYHPIRLAEDVATLDILSHGRMTLAAGTGSATHEFETFNIPPQERHGRTFETMRIVQGMFENEVYDHHGRYFDFPNICLTTRPLQRRLPLFVAANGPKNMRRAGKNGLGLTVSGSAQWHLDEYWEGLKEGGHRVEDVNLCVFRGMGVVVETEREAQEAREKLYPAAGAQFLSYMERREVQRDTISIPEEMRARGEDPGQAVVGPIGTPDYVLSALEAKYKDSAVTHAHANGTSGPFGSRSLWANEVAPVLRTWGRDPVGTEILPEEVKPNTVDVAA